ncbi:MAG: sensor histidine kinase [Nitrospirae bacterium]|nr:sensor histidine kinase [Nitrospirota bacterium]
MAMELESSGGSLKLELSNLNDQLRTEIEIRKRVEEALQKSHDELERLHNLAAHLESLREEERTLIAREIHDELGQSLTALKMDMSWMEGESSKFDGLLREKLKADIEIVNAIIQSVKRICTELRPGILDHLGLGPAIEWQAQEFQKRSGIECRVFLDPENINVSTDMENALFRIFQESLTNVLRHANATKVNVSLVEKSGNIVLKISDNGVGITVEQLSKPNSFGFLGMHERMYPWKGAVSVKGTPNRGTEITVTAPSVHLF